jgi:kexin
MKITCAALGALFSLGQVVYSAKLLPRTYNEFLAQSGGRPMGRKNYDRRVYFAVEVPADNLDLVYEAHSVDGWRFEEPLGHLDNHYIFSVEKGSTAESLLEDIQNGHGIQVTDDASVTERRHESRHHYKRSIVKNGVESLQMLPVKKLYKRAFVESSLDGTWDDVRVPEGRLRQRRRLHRDTSDIVGTLNDIMDGHTHNNPGDSSFQVIEAARKALSINDPIFGDQWHLINPLQPGNDLNITDVWMAGVTGKGIHVAVVDDGLDLEHEDLKDNFYAKGSWDFNDNNPLPKPRLADDQHGTRCAGEIAAVRNDVCGVGVAYEAGIAGLRILSGDISEAEEALALNYAMNDNHIYSCSWGPPDNGEAMDEPGPLVKKAFINGITNGRDQKGSIFVFASGNGKVQGDNCNFDGYTNSIYSITVAAVDRNNLQPYYSESCSANMVVTYSSNAHDYIHTTDIHGKCTDHHGGTSAAAPIAAGVFALALQERPELTWRDLQYLCVDTAVKVNSGDPSWQKTSSGNYYSHNFGYGKLDVYGLVERAKTWDLVKPQAWYWSKPEVVNQPVTFGEPATESTITVTKEDLEAANLERLEHVNVLINMSLENRGVVTVELVSPDGVISRLAEPRPKDDSSMGFKNWTFMSVAHWGETGVGDWKLRVSNNEVICRGELQNWTLKLWGEAIDASKARPFPLSGSNNEVQPSAATSSMSSPTGSPSFVTSSSQTGSSASATTTGTPAGNEGKPSGTNDNGPSASASASPWLWSMVPTFGFSPRTMMWIYGSVLLIVMFVVLLCVYLFVYRRRAGFNRLQQDDFQEGYEFDLVPVGDFVDEGDLSHGHLAIQSDDSDIDDASTAAVDDPRPVSVGKKARTLYSDTPPPMSATIEHEQELFQVESEGDSDTDTDTTKNGESNKRLLQNK